MGKALGEAMVENGGEAGDAGLRLAHGQPMPTAMAPAMPPALATAVAARLARWADDPARAAQRSAVMAALEALEARRRAPAPPPSAPSPSGLTDAVASPVWASPPHVAAPGASGADAAATPWHELRARLDAASPGGGRDLKAVQRFRPDWQRLAVQQRLGQAQRRVPGVAGPLNSHGLLARVLQAMGDSSPAYLQRLLPYAEALVSLEDLLGTSAPEGRDVVAPAADRLPVRETRPRKARTRLVD